MSYLPAELPSWTFERPTRWSRRQHGRSAELALLLRVWPDVEAEMDLWTWEVTETVEDIASTVEVEVEVARAKSRDAAIAAALSRATAFLESGN